MKQSEVGVRAGGSIISIERDVLWVLAAKRFLWQSSQGGKNKALRNQGLPTIGDRVQVCHLSPSTYTLFHIFPRSFCVSKGWVRKAHEWHLSSAVVLTQFCWGNSACRAI